MLNSLKYRTLGGIRTLKYTVTVSHLRRSPCEPNPLQVTCNKCNIWQSHKYQVTLQHLNSIVILASPTYDHLLWLVEMTHHILLYWYIKVKYTCTQVFVSNNLPCNPKHSSIILCSREYFHITLSNPVVKCLQSPKECVHHWESIFLFPQFCEMYLSHFDLTHK